MKSNKKFLSGKFLVASPSMTDPRFHKSVIYVITHKSEGAMGIVINQPIIETKINNIINNEELKNNSNIDNIPITYGGPVDLILIFLNQLLKEMDQRNLFLL